jgi:surfactin synthase thioesterase subunit
MTAPGRHLVLGGWSHSLAPLPVKESKESRPVVAFLPPACYGAGYFRRLRRAFDGRIEFLALELPGRGHRHLEPPITQATAAVADVAAQIGDRVLDASYGESLGAYLGLAVAATIKQPRPPLLFAVSNSPPSVREPVNLDHVNSIETAVAAMKALGGEIPAEVADHPELAGHAYAVVRDDLRLSQSLIESTRETTIAGDIHVIGGDDDTGLIQLGSWANHTKGSCRVARLPGGHLLSRRNPSGVAEAVLSSLASRCRCR